MFVLTLTKALIRFHQCSGCLFLHLASVIKSQYNVISLINHSTIMLLHFVNSNIFCNLKPLTSLCAMCVLSWTHYLSKHLKLAAVTVTLPEGSSLTGKEEVALDDPGFYLLTEHSETLHYQQIIHRWAALSWYKEDFSVNNDWEGVSFCMLGIQGTHVVQC